MKLTFNIVYRLKKSYFLAKKKVANRNDKFLNKMISLNSLVKNKT